jgi:hypothetical protein
MGLAGGGSAPPWRSTARRGDGGKRDAEGVVARARGIREDARRRRSFLCLAADHGRPSEVEEGPDVWVPHVSDCVEETRVWKAYVGGIEG